MAKHEIVRDEQNWQWIVFPEDPAWKFILKLPKTTGLYALPRESLKTGELVDFPEPFFYTQEVPDSLLTNELSEVIVRLDRIYKSTIWLKERNVSNK